MAATSSADRGLSLTPCNNQYNGPIKFDCNLLFFYHYYSSSDGELSVLSRSSSQKKRTPHRGVFLSEIWSIIVRRKIVEHHGCFNHKNMAASDSCKFSINYLFYNIVSVLISEYIDFIYQQSASL